jgi:hypothetical protein
MMQQSLSSPQSKAAIEIISIFVAASGLFTNMEMSECYPIQYASIDLGFLSSANLTIS